MNPVNLVLSLAYIFCGILVTVVCMPLVKGKVKMNLFYGVRIKKSFESEENWYRINKFGAEKLIAWAVLLIVIGIVSLFFPFNSQYAMYIFAGVPVVTIIVPVLQVFIYVRDL
jgi:uncharacterized membrane protein